MNGGTGSIRQLRRSCLRKRRRDQEAQPQGLAPPSSKSRHQAMPGVAKPAAMVRRGAGGRRPARLRNDGARVQTLLPDDPAFDMAVNILTHQPGAGRPRWRCEATEHGMVMLRGQGHLRLDVDLDPVQAGRRDLERRLLPAMVRSDREGPGERYRSPETSTGSLCRPEACIKLACRPTLPITLSSTCQERVESDKVEGTKWRRGCGWQPSYAPACGSAATPLLPATITAVTSRTRS